MVDDERDAAATEHPPGEEPHQFDPTGWRSGLGWYRPRLVDGVMALLGFATLAVWSAGVTRGRFALIIVSWLLVWVWRLVADRTRIWSVLIAVVTVLVVLSGVPHVAQRMARSCTTELALAMLDDEPLTPVEDVAYAAHGRLGPSGDVRQPSPGGCGLLHWRHSAVIDVNEDGRSRQTSSPVASAVILFDAGPLQLNPFTHTNNGYVYSPDRAPESCRDVAGRPNANNGYATCTVEPVGGDWYWFVAENSAD